jgi:two-component system, sensor histidine kinase and response regulator
MNTNLKPNRPVFAMRTSTPGFHDTIFHRTNDMHAGTPYGKIAGVDPIFGAPTALQRAQARQAAAESANKAKSDFLADISHEIRQPMSAIIGLTNILLSTKLDNRQKQCLTVLLGSAEALMVMLKSFLDVGKIESGTIDLEYKPFNIGDLLDQVVGIMLIKAQEKNIGLTLHCEAGLPEAFIGDSGRIRQILINLVGNAIKFTETGGVTVSFAAAEERNGEKQIAISVMDTGIGISEDKTGHIFDRFIQADPSIADKYGGTGLGLSISKALAENMGGNISVTSAIGQGSTFTLHLPLRTEENGEDLVISRKFQPLTYNEEQFS